MFEDVEYLESVTREKFVKMVKDLNLKPPVLIKPNWGFSVIFTEAIILDWVLSAIEGEKIIIESYGWARCQEAVKDRKYGSFEKDDLRKSDSWFLDYSGIGEILEKHDVEFVNITEEVWGGRTVEAEQIKQHVEDRYPPAHIKDIYSYVPECLYEMRGGSLLSLAKLKFMGEDIVISLSIKNLFGMIPGPDRGMFHGYENKSMNPSIVDMNKVYRSLFELAGIVDAVFTASRGMTLNPTIYSNKKIAWAGKDTLNLDAVVSAHVGIDPHDVGHLMDSAKCFGSWDDKAVSEAIKSGLPCFD